MESGQWPNRRLRLQRRLRGWSQEDVATGLHRLAAVLGEPELGVDATMVGRWERGARRPRPRYVRLLCRLFEVPAEQLGFLDDPDLGPASGRTPGAGEDDVERRDFIRTLAALLGAAAIPMPGLAAASEPWERLARALRRPGSVDSETVDHLERITVALEALGTSQVSPGAALGPAVGHLDAITELLAGPLSPGLRARLCSLAGETAGLAGWLRWDVDDAAGAEAYFRAGVQAAREAQDRALETYLLASAACQPPYRESPQRRIDLLQTPGPSAATAATRVWLAAKEADAYALMGRADGCLRALERAQRALEQVQGDEGVRRPRFTRIGRTWLDGERGASLAKLGRTADARPILESVLPLLGPTGERDRLWLCAALAGAYVRDEEPEEACRVMRTALEGASRMRLEPILKVVRGMRGELDRYGASPALEELDEQLRANLQVS